MSLNALAGLNPQQTAAVEALDGPVLVFAGAGSGKTRVLTHRVAHLISSGKAEPQEVLAVTFTNKAAGEMRDRIIGIVGEGRGYVSMGTFHSICASILRRDAHNIGFDPGFTIYDDEDGQKLVKSIMQDQQIPTDQVKPSAVFYNIKQYKSRMLFPDDAADLALSSFDEKVVKIYGLYQQRLKLNNAMDFDDLLLKPLDLFGQFPSVLSKYQRNFRYILVDEYQDTNRAQFLFVEALSREHRNLCVVGDDDQSIYGWRGADISNILDFKEAFPDAQVFKLEQNYRSTKTIVAAASAVVGKNINRQEKELFTEQDQGDPIKVMDARDDLDEGRLIVEEIQTLRRESELTFKDFSILYRTNAQSRSLEDVLRRIGIPYQIIGGTRFYERREIKDILAYFRLVINPADDISFLRVINIPTRGIGLTSQQKIAQYAVKNGISNFAAATQPEQIDLGTRAEKRVKEFTSLIEELAGQSQEMDLNNWARSLVDRLGFIESYRKDHTDESLARIDNIYELLSAIDEYVERAENPSLVGYMEEVSLLTDIDNYNRDGEQVTLMTLHSAKGLEFPIVFLAGMEDGLFPLQRSMDEPDALEEERRLFYVGVTRAMQRAYLSAARVRQRYGELMVSRPSRFIDEIPVELLERVEEPVLVRTPRAASRSRSYDGGITRPSQRKRSIQAVAYKAPDATYAAGMSVEHAFFGSGKITRVEGEGPDAKLTVVFQGNMQKKLIAKFANLKIKS